MVSRIYFQRNVSVTNLKTKPIFENIGSISFYNGLLEKTEKKKAKNKRKKQRSKQSNKEIKKKNKEKSEILLSSMSVLYN